MKRNRKIIVYIATSADGHIARPDGDTAWLDRPQPAGAYGMAAFFRSIDTILWGRKTYDLALARGPEGGLFGQEIKNYVFSHRPPAASMPGVEFVTEPIGAFAKRLRAAQGKDIWIMGGGGLIASFLDAGEIDEFIIHIIPVFIGEGIPLIQPRQRLVPLALLSSRRYSDGVMRLHYRVLPQRKTKLVKA
ncbi:MAG: dihydrofolate reductase family protein [Acidobacteriota bacterium]